MRKSNVRRKYNLVATIVAINILGIHTNSRCVCVSEQNACINYTLEHLPNKTWPVVSYFWALFKPQLLRSFQIKSDYNANRPN